MLAIIIIFISLYLDGFLTLFLPYLPGNLSLFTPMLTIVSLLIIYPLYRKQEKKYFITVFILGIIYDLLYTNLLFFNAIVFLFLGVIIKFIYKNLDVSHIKISLYILGLIIIYELVFSFFILLFNLVPFTVERLLYKIVHSIILNVLYGELLLFIINHLPKRFKRININ